MDMDTDCKTEGSVVWVRVKNSKLWWVGQVTLNYPQDLLGRSKIPPVAIVKYFPIPSPEGESTNGDADEEQDEYEVVRKEHEILPYQSDKKEELIRKGKVHLSKDQDQSERFIRDCKKAESLTQGDESYVDTVSTAVQHVNKSNIWAEICKPVEPPAPSKTPVTSTPSPGRSGSGKQKRSGGSGSAAKRARTAPVPDKKYFCKHCSFGTDRLTVFSLHLKSHVGQSSKDTSAETREGSVAESSGTKSGSTVSPKGTPKGKASPQKSPVKTRGRKRKPPKGQAKQEILADWEEEEKDENADSDTEDLPPVLEAKKPRSAVDLFDSLFKNRSPGHEGTEGKSTEVPESKYRRKDSEDTHSDIDSSEESENILKAVGPTSDRKDSLSETDPDDLPPPELEPSVKEPVAEKAKSKSPEPKKSPRNKSIEPEAKTRRTSESKEEETKETPKSNSRTPANPEPRRSSRRPADVPSKYKDEETPIVTRKKGAGRPKNQAKQTDVGAETSKKEEGELNNESVEPPNSPKKEVEALTSPKEEVIENPKKEIAELETPKSPKKEPVAAEIPTSPEKKESVASEVSKSPKETSIPEILKSPKQETVVSETHKSTKKNLAKPPKKEPQIIVEPATSTPTKKQAEPPKSPTKKQLDQPKSPAKKVPEPLKSPTKKAAEPPKSPTKKVAEPPKSPPKKVTEPPKSPPKKVTEPPKSPTKKTIGTDLPSTPKKQTPEIPKTEGKSSTTKMDQSNRRASMPGAGASNPPILLASKPGVIQIKGGQAKQQAEKLIILPQSNASSTPGTTTYKIIQQGTGTQAISLQPQQPQQQIIYLTQPTQGTATSASQQVQYILNQNQMILASTPSSAPTALKKTPVQASKNIINPVLSTSSAATVSTTPMTASALVKKQATKPTATIKPNPVAEEKPKVATKQDEIVTDKVVHLLPVENHDGSVTYMFVSLDDTGTVKIDSAEGPKLAREESHIFVDKPTEPKKILNALTRHPTPTTPAILQQKKSAARKPAQATTTTPTQPKIIRAPPATAAAQAKLAASASVVQTTASSMIHQQQPLNQLTQQILTQQIQEPVVSPVTAATIASTVTPISAPATQVETPIQVQDIQIPSGSVLGATETTDGTTIIAGEEQQYYTTIAGADGMGQFDGQTQYILEDLPQGMVGEGIDFSQLGVDGDTIYLLQEDGTLIHPSAVGLNLNNLNQLTLSQDSGSQQQ